MVYSKFDPGCAGCDGDYECRDTIFRPTAEGWPDGWTAEGEVGTDGIATVWEMLDGHAITPPSSGILHRQAEAWWVTFEVVGSATLQWGNVAVALDSGLGEVTLSDGMDLGTAPLPADGAVTHRSHLTLYVTADWLGVIVRRFSGADDTTEVRGSVQIHGRASDTSMRSLTLTANGPLQLRSVRIADATVTVIVEDGTADPCGRPTLPWQTEASHRFQDSAPRTPFENVTYPSTLQLLSSAEAYFHAEYYCDITGVDPPVTRTFAGSVAAGFADDYAGDSFGPMELIDLGSSANLYSAVVPHDTVDEDSCGTNGGYSQFPFRAARQIDRLSLTAWPSSKPEVPYAQPVIRHQLVLDLDPILADVVPSAAGTAPATLGGSVTWEPHIVNGATFTAIEMQWSAQ